MPHSMECTITYHLLEAKLSFFLISLSSSPLTHSLYFTISNFERLKIFRIFSFFFFCNRIIYSQEDFPYPVLSTYSWLCIQEPLLMSYGDAKERSQVSLKQGKHPACCIIWFLNPNPASTENVKFFQYYFSPIQKSILICKRLPFLQSLLTRELPHYPPKRL